MCRLECLRNTSLFRVVSVECLLPPAQGVVVGCLVAWFDSLVFGLELFLEVRASIEIRGAPLGAVSLPESGKRKGTDASPAEEVEICILGRESRKLGP